MKLPGWMRTNSIPGFVGRNAGVVFFAGAVFLTAGGALFFGGAVFFGDGKVAFGSCADVARLAGRCEGMKSITIPQTIKTRVRRVRKEWLFLFIGYPSKQFGETTNNLLWIEIKTAKPVDSAQVPQREIRWRRDSPLDVRGELPGACGPRSCRAAHAAPGLASPAFADSREIGGICTANFSLPSDKLKPVVHFRPAHFVRRRVQKAKWQKSKRQRVSGTTRIFPFSFRHFRDTPRNLRIYLSGIQPPSPRVPSWSKEPKGFINARAETLEEKPSFSESFQRRRCLIPADGFYERSGRSKQPYYFQMKDESPFAFAGIWDKWQGDDLSITSCAIITTTPNELLATIHDRMPVILAAETQESWLRENAKPAELKELLVPFP